MSYTIIKPVNKLIKHKKLYNYNCWTSINNIILSIIKHIYKVNIWNLNVLFAQQ